MTRAEALERMEAACTAAHAQLDWSMRAEGQMCAGQAERLAHGANAGAAVARAWGELAALLPAAGPASRTLPRAQPIEK